MVDISTSPVKVLLVHFTPSMARVCFVSD